MNKATDSFFETTTERGQNKAQMVLLLLFAAATILFAYFPLKTLMSSNRSDYYSHILLVPFVTAYFLFVQRKRIAELVEYSLKDGVWVGSVGILLYGLALWQRKWLGINDFASLTTAGSIVGFWAGFLLLFGRQAFWAARFPLLFLLFAVPAPLFLLNSFIYVLQVGSTEVTQWLFDLTGTAYFREGFVYQLVGITIEVARECSGIRSSIALIITGVLAGHFFLGSGWKTLCLLIALLPITIIKNGIRILTLSLLAVHVDRKFITDSFLHHSGGFLFYIPALGLLALTIWGLRKVGKKNNKGGRLE